MKALYQAILLFAIANISLFAANTTYNTAILVSNKAGPALDEKTPVLEDMLAAKVSELGLKVISREVVVNSLQSFDGAGKSAEQPKDNIDAVLADQSSALRLAQGMGADYILLASIVSMDEEKRDVSAYGNQFSNDIYTMRVSYRILDAGNGGAIAGDVVTATRTLQKTTHTQTRASSMSNDLLVDATSQIANALRLRLAQAQLSSSSNFLVTINIDVQVQGLEMPDVRIADGNTVTIEKDAVRVIPLNVTVEIDGVAVGTAPGPLQVRPGFSRIRLSREGFKPWERIISASEGQQLFASMEMSDEGIARWKDLTSFVQALSNEAKLTDAQVKVLEGEAQKLSQSGYRVDVKVDTKEGIKVENNYSIFDKVKDNTMSIPANEQ